MFFFFYTRCFETNLKNNTICTMHLFPLQHKSFIFPFLLSIHIWTSSASSLLDPRPLPLHPWHKSCIFALFSPPLSKPHFRFLLTFTLTSKQMRLQFTPPQCESHPPATSDLDVLMTPGSDVLSETSDVKWATTVTVVGMKQSRAPVNWRRGKCCHAATRSSGFDKNSSSHACLRRHEEQRRWRKKPTVRAVLQTNGAPTNIHLFNSPTCVYEVVTVHFFTVEFMV